MSNDTTCCEANDDECTSTVGWFVATALGNKLVSIPGHMWDMPLYIVWGTLMGICLLAALFIFSIIKKLNKVA